MINAWWVILFSIGSMCAGFLVGCHYAERYVKSAFERGWVAAYDALRSHKANERTP